MAIETKRALFMELLGSRESDQADINTANLSLKYVELSEEAAARVWEQMAEYRVVMHESYEYEYDEDDYPTRGSDTKIFEVADMVSLKSGCYSTNEVRGDIVLRGGMFAGVILYMYKKGGNGWDNYDYWWYTVMFTDGSRTKDNVSYYSFSGSSSSKYYEYTYTLEKKGE
jgi:hypothetical protein